MRPRCNAIAIVAAVVMIAGVAVGTAEKNEDVPPGFDRPLVIDRYLERKVVALEKQVAELQQAVEALRQEVRALKADGQP